MIILDTNVVLEPSRAVPNPAMLGWMDQQGPEQLWLTAITAAELLAGVEKLPPGRERQTREAEVASILDEYFRGKVLPFDLEASFHYAALAGPLIRAERNVRTMDLQIAAIALSHGAAVATRNVHDFQGCGVELINPWEA